jgi:hypothetical protein
MKHPVLWEFQKPIAIRGQRSLVHQRQYGVVAVRGMLKVTSLIRLGVSQQDQESFVGPTWAEFV